MAGLTSLGWRLDVNDKSKYEAYRKPGDKHKLFVGPNGALRSGECASRSFSMGDATRLTPFYKSILEAGDKMTALPVFE